MQEITVTIKDYKHTNCKKKYNSPSIIQHSLKCHKAIAIYGDVFLKVIDKLRIHGICTYVQAVKSYIVKILCMPKNHIVSNSF